VTTRWESRSTIARFAADAAMAIALLAASNVTVSPSYRVTE
jgi:hypothetical protein